jgi:putative transposase
MPRRPRIHLDGVSLHIVQRGHSRQPCFFADAAYRELFEQVLSDKTIK